ncbi:MAG: GGDEF domain-containing protein [Butyrivibrio sp.]|nr:GGDEF domain-containing protein [Butyrivibrio sp.]
MIEKLYQSYDDCNYYIETNKKKLAHDNADAISGMLTFFALISIFAVGVALAFGNAITHYDKYIPAIILLILMFAINKKISKRLDYNFLKVRIYALIVYSLLIIAFAIADISIYSYSRAVFFPVAIIALSGMYMDYFWITVIYKLVLAVIFLFCDYRVKDSYVFMSDLVVACLAIIASMFCYSVIISISLTRHEDSEQLVKKSQTDLLTGLLNKISFEEHCKNYLDKRVIGARCTMFIFDLDDFKDVNDNYGHQTGDKVLKLFSEILKGYFHPDDIIGRVGGDEFMVLVLGEMPEGFAERRCRSIIHELKTTEVDGDKGVTVSIGIAEDTQGHGFDELYHKADEALYKAKEGGKARFEHIMFD